jgi:DNA-binding XRE family transcriptional regulator
LIALNHVPTSLNATKVIRVLRSLKTHPHWENLITQTNLLVTFSKQNPPQAIRVADFITKISRPLGIPFYIIWTWMCTDFQTNNLDPFLATDNYLKALLCEADYKRLKDYKGPLNFRKALKRQRIKLGLSLGKMADKIGIQRDKIIVLEREENYTSIPRCDTLNAVLPFYELHPVELLLLAIKESTLETSTLEN